MGPAIFLTLVCLVPVGWFESGAVIQIADYNNPLNAERAASRISAGWDSDNLGEPTVRETALLFPQLTFWRAGEMVGLSPTATQLAWMMSLLILTILSCWSLVRLLADEHRQVWALLVVGSVYLFNPFTLYSWTVGHNLAYLAYACAPLWIATLVRTIRTPLSVRSGWRLGAVSLLFASAFASSPGTVLAMIVLPTILITLLMGAAREMRAGDLVKRVLAGAAWCVTLNAWWLVPIGREFLRRVEYSYAGSSWSLFEYPALTTSVEFVEFVRGLGYWGAYQAYNGVPYVAWAAFLASPLAIAATLWLTMCALLPLAQRRRDDLWSVCAGGLFVLGVFFSKGVNPPAGAANRWLYEEVPGFVLFRSTYQNFGGLTFLGTVIALTVLIGRPRLSNRLRVLVSGGTITAVLVSGWPLLTGSVVEDQTQRGVSATVQIPPYYTDLKRWSARVEPTDAILVLPMPPSGYLRTTWGLQGPDLIYNYIVPPVITGEVEARPSDGFRFRALLTAASAFDEPVLLKKLGVAYVLVRSDISPGHYPGTADPTVIATRLEEAGFRRVATIGAFKIYDVPGRGSSLEVASTILVSSSDEPISERVALGFSRPIAEPTPVPPEGAQSFCEVRPVDLSPVGLVVGVCRGLVGQARIQASTDRRFTFIAKRRNGVLSVSATALPESVEARSRITGSEDADIHLRVPLGPYLAGVRIGSLILPTGGETKTATGVLSVRLGGDVELLRTGGSSRLQDGSFERSLWNGGNYSGGAPAVGLAARASTDATDGNRSLELISNGGRVATSRALEGFDPADLYKISFDYKHVAGEGPAFAVWEAVTDRVVAESALSDEPGWHHFETIVDPSPAAGGLHLYLYSEAGADGRTVNRFDNVTASSVPSPPRLLLETDTRSQATPDPRVEIDSAESTSIGGRVHGVRQSVWIVFPQSFHPDWDLIAYSQTGQRLSVLNHVRVNGFANAWLVEGDGTISFEVRYRPSQTRLTGFAVSASGFALGLILSLWARLAWRPMLPRRPTFHRKSGWWR